LDAEISREMVVVVSETHQSGMRHRMLTNTLSDEDHLRRHQEDYSPKCLTGFEAITGFSTEGLVLKTCATAEGYRLVVGRKLVKIP
jgi:hypothetical protein